MRKRDRKALGEYCRDVADRIELRDWHIDLSHEPAGDPAWATSECIFGRRRVVLRFCEEFRSLTPDDQRNVVVHELVHCHLAALQSQLERDLERHLGLGADRVFFDSARRNLEYAVDGLASALAKHLPPIEWP